MFAQRGRVESQASSVPVVAKALVRIPALQFQSTRAAFFTAFLQNSAATKKSNAPLPPPPKPAPKPASSSISAMMAKVLHFTHAATFATRESLTHLQSTAEKKAAPAPAPAPAPAKTAESKPPVAAPQPAPVTTKASPKKTVAAAAATPAPVAAAAA